MSNNKLPERKPEICSGRAEPRKRNILDVRKFFWTYAKFSGRTQNFAGTYEQIFCTFVDVRKIFWTYAKFRLSTFPYKILLDVRKICVRKFVRGRTNNFAGAYAKIFAAFSQLWTCAKISPDVRKNFPRRRPPTVRMLRVKARHCRWQR